VFINFLQDFTKTVKRKLQNFTRKTKTSKIRTRDKSKIGLNATEKIRRVTKLQQVGFDITTETE